MPIYSKKHKKNLVQNHWVDCLETWYEAYGELVLYKLFNDDSGLTLTNLRARSNFVP